MELLYAAVRDASWNVGITLPERILFDGKIHRFNPSNGGTKGDAGWYVLNYDGSIGWGAIGDWSTGEKLNWCSEKKLTKEIKKRIRKDATAAERERKKNQRKCAIQAREIWDKAVPAIEHPYLTNKGVGPHNSRVLDDALIIPVYGETGDLVSVQQIYADGKKTFLFGTPVTGSWSLIGEAEDAKTVIICEGWATGATCHKATGLPVYVAWSAGNLPNASTGARERHQEADLIIAADNDAWNKDGTVRASDANAGMVKAREAAAAAGAVIKTIPAEKQGVTDFNDWAREHGIQAVKDILLSKDEPKEEFRDEMPDYDYYDEPQDSEPIEFFKALGYYENNFYFYSYQAERVVEISRSAMGAQAALLQIAPLKWWSMKDLTTEGDNIKTAKAADMLIADCYKKGLFDDRDVRGRGAWDDNGRSVLHVGNELIVDGNKMPLHDFKTAFFYEKRRSMDVDFCAPIKTASAYKLLEICRLIRWEDPIYAELLAGWLVIAPICGALIYRPHIYLIGPSGAGKSWVVEQVIEATLGKTAFKTSSKSTAAGIRQAIQSDAIPVVFDEAETEGKSDSLRIQEIFDLARVSFNGEAAPIHKGTADQTGKTFAPRSCFAFASINLSMKRIADETRTSILKLAVPSKDCEEIERERETFKELERLAVETIDDEWRGGMLARTVKMIPTIKKNAKIFSREVALYFGSNRQGDQLGPILAGLYALHSVGVVDKKAAKNFIEKREWVQQKEIVEDSSHLRLWNYLLECEVRVDGNTRTFTRTINDLIEVVTGGYDGDISVTTANNELRRKGFKVEAGYIFVSNTSSWIAGKLQNTEWLGKWHLTLKNMPDSISGISKRFVTMNRSVGIPIEDKKPFIDEVEF